MSDHEWWHSILLGIGVRAEVFAEIYPRPYLWFVTVFALLGYACLLLFPLLVLAGIAGICRALVASPGVAWQSLLAWLFVIVSCGLVSYRLFRFRPCLPAGAVLSRQQAPALFQLVEETGAHYPGHGIDCIVITDGYQLDIVKTPVLAMPVWSTRSLLVGLPLLQCLSMPRFKCSLARRLGQFSGRSNRLLNWLYSLRSIWPVYRESTPRSPPVCLPVRALFSLYAPLYTAISTAAARQDELQADSYAMELFSDEDVLEAITTDAVHRLFLRESYWPAIRKLSEKDVAVATNTHARMAAVMRTGLHGANLSRWVDKAMSAEQHWDDPWPTLVRRLENIGHAQAGMITGTGEPTADVCLDISGSQIEVAFTATPPLQVLQPPPWPAVTDTLRRSCQAARHALQLRFRNLVHPGQQAGETEH